MYNNRFKQFVDIINLSQNPQQTVMNMLEERANQNPVFKNIAGLVQSGDTQKIETIVRNIAKEQGVDFDREFNSFKQMFKR